MTKKRTKNKEMTRVLCQFINKVIICQQRYSMVIFISGFWDVYSHPLKSKMLFLCPLEHVIYSTEFNT